MNIYIYIMAASSRPVNEYLCCCCKGVACLCPRRYFMPCESHLILGYTEGINYRFSCRKAGYFFTYWNISLMSLCTASTALVNTGPPNYCPSMFGIMITYCKFLFIFVMFTFKINFDLWQATPDRALLLIYWTTNALPNLDKELIMVQRLRERLSLLLSARPFFF